MITDYSDSPSLGPVQREILSQEASLFQILDPGQTGERLDWAEHAWVPNHGVFSSDSYCRNAHNSKKWTFCL